MYFESNGLAIHEESLMDNHDWINHSSSRVDPLRVSGKL